jgi:hypothetical protein
MRARMIAAAVLVLVAASCALLEVQVWGGVNSGELERNRAGKSPVDFDGNALGVTLVFGMARQAEAFRRIAEGDLVARLPAPPEGPKLATMKQDPEDARREFARSFGRLEAQLEDLEQLPAAVAQVADQVAALRADVVGLKATVDRVEAWTAQPGVDGSSGFQLSGDVAGDVVALLVLLASAGVAEFARRRGLLGALSGRHRDDRLERKRTRSGREGA